MMTYLAFLVVLVTVVTLCVGKECYDAPGNDGCTIPDWADKFVPYQGTFTPACYKHDVCYACGTVRGVSRYTCDTRFKYNMRRRCGTFDFWCRTVAQMYYWFVREHGDEHNHYKNPSRDWCQESWVSKCMT